MDDLTEVKNFKYSETTKIFKEAQDFLDYPDYDQNTGDLNDAEAFLEEVHGVLSKVYQKNQRRERYHQKQHPKRQENWL